jgi:hypothetical protein
MKPLDQALHALRSDLIHPDGPQISAMRNYRFAILPYDPEQEFALRRGLHQLTAELRAESWVVISISLQKLLMDRIRKEEGGTFFEDMMAREKMFHPIAPDSALNDLRDKIAQLVSGPDGIAADVSRLIETHVQANPDRVDRMVAFIGRAGALYPFFRVSALLRFLDSHNKAKPVRVPVVLLYPGSREKDKALRFMGELPPTTDYRPRIYP